MRIIDSNKDFYDYIQNIYYDNTYTFDRSDSYDLRRDEFGKHFLYEAPIRYSHKDMNPKVLLQVGFCFWLFDIIILEHNKFRECEKYEMKLVDTWKDYNTTPVTINLAHIRFPWWYMKDESKNLIEAVKQKNFRVEYVFNRFHIYKDHGMSFEKIEKHIPILKNIGIASLVSPEDIYLALEEYFSWQKTRSERTDAIGMTNDDKIVEHGFDVKTSFRGKKSITHD